MSLALELKQLKQLNPTASDLRKFSWLVSGGFLVLGLLLWYLGKSWYPTMLWIGGVLAVVGTVLPLLVKPFYYVWMAIGTVLGFVMTRVILTIFFFLVLTPVGLFFRLIGRDALHRKLDRAAASYWIEKEYLIADRTRFEKFF